MTPAFLRVLLSVCGGLQFKWATGLLLPVLPQLS